MGQEVSTLEKNGYKVLRQTSNAVVATRENDTFLIKTFILNQRSGNANQALTKEIQFLKTANHPHIVSAKNSFEVGNTHYVVLDYCHGGSLAAKINQMSAPPKESEVLSWMVEICVALGTIHENGFLHRNLTPESVFFNEFGMVCLSAFGQIHESKNTQSTTNWKDGVMKIISYQAPEVFTEVETYDTKSDVWSMGCILYELCTRRQVFSGKTSIKIIPKIIGGHYPSLPQSFSPELRQLLTNMLSKDLELRPTASEILMQDIFLKCLLQKSKTTVADLQTKLNMLRALADGLERVHQGTTIGSLTGGVIGAAGGITSIVGLILAPFTLGASLIVTGVGVGVSVLGGLTAGSSNIVNMVNKSSDQKAIQSIIKEMSCKINAVVTWLQQISFAAQTVKARCDSPGAEDGQFNTGNLFRLGCRAGRGLGGIGELIQLTQVMSIGRIAAQATRAVRVAEVATGVFSGLFVAVDVFFIAMDAKELHNISQAKAAQGRGETSSEPRSVTKPVDFGSTSGQSALTPSSLMREVELDRAEAQDSAPENTAPIKSEIMKFVLSIRRGADNLQKVLDELKTITSSFSPQRMESM